MTVEARKTVLGLHRGAGEPLSMWSETGKQVSRDEWITHYETAGAEAARATNASRPKRAFGIGERILET